MAAPDESAAPAQACCIELQACVGPVAALGYAATCVAAAQMSLSDGAPAYGIILCLVVWNRDEPS